MRFFCPEPVSVNSGVVKVPTVTCSASRAAGRNSSAPQSPSYSLLRSLITGVTIVLAGGSSGSSAVSAT